jgi:hypothetical protein
VTKSYSRSTFIEHRSQLGIYLPESKKQAILSGDISGDSVHPSLIPMAHLFGHLYQLRRHPEQNFPVLDDSEEMYIRATVASCSDMAPGDTSIVDFVRAHTLMAMYRLRLSNAGEGLRLLNNTKEIVEARGVRFLLQIPWTHDGSAVASPIAWQGSTDETLERITTLAQLIFIESVWSFVTQQPSPYTELEHQFRTELLVSFRFSAL